MALVNKQDSNFTELRYAVEVSPGVVDGSAVWTPLEPNSYKTYGGDVKTKARMPINASRQRKKGVVVDLDAGVGFEQDLTQTNFQDLAQSFLFAALRKKSELAVAAVDGTTNAYLPAAGGTGYAAGDLLFAKGAGSALNNGLKVVTGTPTGTSVTVTDTGLVTASTQAITISRVGFEFGAGELTVDVSGDFPKLVSSGARALNTFGLIPGEFIFVGDDVSTKRFFHATNNGFCRVRSVSATEIVLDKTQGIMVTDDGTVNGSGGAGNTVRIYFGRVAKNESDPTLIVTRGIQFERTMGAPDSALPSQIQAEYVTRALANTWTLDCKTADIVSYTMDFQANTNEVRTGAEGVKAGTRPSLVDSDAFNATNDVAFTKMALVESDDSCPAPLFSFFTDLKVEVKNNIKQNKAVSVLGAFDSTPGFFDVSASVSAYFTDVAEIQAVKDNRSVTIEQHFVKFNAGVSIDLPLVTLSKALADVKINEPIMIPLTIDAATAKAIDVTLDHTMLMVFWDYLPTLAA